MVINDKIEQKKWDEFVKNNSSDFGLLQAWAWGDFYESLGRKVYRLAVIEEEEILAIAQVIKMPLRFGRSYFYAPRGPVAQCHPELVSGSQIKQGGILKQVQDDGLILDLLFSEIEKLAQKEGAIFLRIEPPVPSARGGAMGQAGFDGVTMTKRNFKFVGQVQPKKTLILDLQQSEEELLKQMKQKTRYNIKLAEKHQITIDEGQSYFDDFWRLTKKTAKRQEIKPHGEIYYRQMVRVLGDIGVLKLMVAKDDNQVIAANLGVVFGSWAVYLHGASDYDFRDKMAPFLLQWQMIKNAKKSGCQFYDFWGVDEKKWPGVTRFKFGFAPNVKPTEYVGAWDEVYKIFWYNLYRLIKMFIK